MFEKLGITSCVVKIIVTFSCRHSEYERDSQLPGESGKIGNLTVVTEVPGNLPEYRELSSKTLSVETVSANLTFQISTLFVY